MYNGGQGEAAMQSELSALHFHNEAAAFAYVEARLWPNGATCPHCGVMGKAGKLTRERSKPSKKNPNGKPTVGMWKCYACRKKFTVRMGTIFEASHVDMRIWLQTFYLMASSKKGIATRQLHRTFGGSMKTAWFLGHRVREAMRALGFGPGGQLGGANRVVEADETYVGGKAANRKNHIPSKEIVLSLVERDGKVRSFHVPNVTAATLGPVIHANIDKATYLMTDESTSYPPVAKPFAGHGTVNHSAEEYVRGFFWHTNTVENYFSIFKRGIYGCYFHVSVAHLHRYAAEFDFRYNNRIKLGVDDVQRVDLMLKGAVGKRLTYRTVGGLGPAETLA
jgi:transposase-like protein